jgi:UDP-N-acetylglucosamine--N-acetylmuramyl-(pentapeptide) pyrophosphoryl-undecaprenol N-acetylglucosamine transferase
MTGPVVIAAGGTGGHMFPALALAAELQRRGQAVALACDARGARYLPPDQPCRLIRAGSPSGGMIRRVRGTVELARGFLQSLVWLRRLSPTAITVFGGYAAVPVGFAAGMLGVPLLVHEQNAVLGRANRLLARRAGCLALTFAGTRQTAGGPGCRRLVTGNPVRPAVAALSGAAYRAPAADGPVELLVIGGSQGARSLSDAVPAAVRQLAPALRGRLRLTQQCRPEDLARVATTYRDLGFEAELHSFFDDLPDRLAKAHLVISRAGASSVAELLALGRPAILIPYRHAADDHQTANAETVAAAGAGWVLAESDLTGASLAALLTDCLSAPDRLPDVAAKAQRLGRPDAAQALADAVLDLAGRPAAATRREALA